MDHRALRCALVAAAFLMLATASAGAGTLSTGSLKLGASGQVYIWQAGTC